MIWQRTGVGARYDSRKKWLYKQMSKGCEMYEPCPINYKCMNKAPHLYLRCANCQVPHATHNYKARVWAIRRENFAIKVTPETGEKFLELSRLADEQEKS